MHTEHTQQPGIVWDSEARSEPVSRDYLGEELVEASMDIEGDRGGAISDVV